MKKSELVSHIAEHSGVSKVFTERVLSCFFKTSRDVILKGGKINFIGIGVVQVIENTRERKMIKFQPSTTLRKELDRKAKEA